MSEVLLDTSFILPSLGIDTGEDVRKGLVRLRTLGLKVWCSHFTIMEALWVGARLVRQDVLDEEAFQHGLRSILKGGRYLMVEEDPEVYTDALRLFSLGHGDMIDNLLYSTSKRLGLRFLTIDEKFRTFIRSKGLKDTLVFPAEL